MVKNVRPLKSSIPSPAWLNAVRNRSGSEYRDRIPEATQANLRDTIENIWNWIPGRNQVEDALVNQLALVMFHTQIWNNPLAIWKMGFLAEGETIEEVAFGLIQSVELDYARDDLEKEVFAQANVPVMTAFHKRNRQSRYKFTVNLPGLRQALLGNQLGSFAAGVMNAARTSDQFDEFLLMAQVLKEFDRAENGYFIVNVPDVSEQNSDAADSRYMLRRLREMKNLLPFISTKYNPAGMPVAANPDELVLIVSATADAAMDVEALAAAFNIDRAKFESRKVVLPAEYLPEGTQAILTTDKFFVVADQLIQTTSIFNPANMITNYWLHHWQIISGSPFAPLIMFSSTRASTVVSDVLTPTTDIGAFTFTDANGVVEAGALRRGTLYDVRVEGTTTPAGGVSALDLDITGSLSSLTRVVNTGSLYIGIDEQAVSLTITATAVDNDYTESVTRGVKGLLIVPNGPGLTAQTDADDDGLNEVVPVAPDFDNNTITIPSINGVQYKDGATNLNNGAVIPITANKTITAVARANKELAPGAPTSFDFVYVP